MVRILAFLVYVAYPALVGYGIRRALRRQPYRPWITRLDPKAVAGVRIATGGISLGIGVVTVALFGFWDKHASESEAFVRSLVLGLIVVGSLLYAIGSVMWRRRLAFRFRLVGFLAMAGPAAVPSQATLLLPLIAPLVVTLHQLGDKDKRKSSASNRSPSSPLRPGGFGSLEMR